MSRGFQFDKMYQAQQVVVEKLNYKVGTKIYSVYCRKVHFTGNIYQIIDWLNSFKVHYKFNWFLNNCMLIEKQ